MSTPSFDKSLNQMSGTDDLKVVSDPAIIRRVEIMCALYEMAYEMKSLELKRRYPDQTYEWIRSETFRLIELGTR